MALRIPSYGDEEGVQALSALAHPTRLMIVRLVAKAEPIGAAAGELGRALDLPSATSSFHLKELTRSKVLRSRKEGRSVIFNLDQGGISSLLKLLTTDVLRGADEAILSDPVTDPPGT
jgi:ArsR family transcriptional regulator